MRILLRVASLMALLGVLAPSVLFVFDTIDLSRVKTLTVIATVAWFVITPLWMWRQTPAKLEPQGLP